MKDSFKSSNFSFARMVQSSIDYYRGHYADKAVGAINLAIYEREKSELPSLLQTKTAQSSSTSAHIAQPRFETSSHGARPLSGLFYLKSFISPQESQDFTPTDSFQASPVGVFSRQFSKFQRECKFYNTIRQHRALSTTSVPVAGCVFS